MNKTTKIALAILSVCVILVIIGIVWLIKVERKALSPLLPPTSSATTTVEQPQPEQPANANDELPDGKG